MLQINRQTDYAVRIILAKQGEGARLSSSTSQRERSAHSHGIDATDRRAVRTRGPDQQFPGARAA